MRSNESRFRELVQLFGREATPFIKIRLTATLLLLVTSAVLAALGPVALKYLVDHLSVHEPHGAPSPLLLLVALYVACQWLARAVSEVRGLMYRRVQRRMFRTLSERLFAHLMHLPLRFHLDRQTGAVSETLANGLEGIQLVFNQFMVTILPVTAELVTILVILTRMAPPPFPALFCGALVLYAGSFLYSSAKLSESARAASAARVEAGAAITDGLLNYEVTKYFTAESLVQHRVGRALARSEGEWLIFSQRFARSGLIAATIFAAFLGATIGYATIDVLHGRMSVGGFVLVNAYLLQLVRPVEMLGFAMQSVSQGLAMLEKMMHLFRESPEPAHGVRTGIAPGPGMLEFMQVRLSYRKDQTVLADVSFTIAPKRTLGIVGPSGSGKSTIVRLLMRLVEPDGGLILLDGTPISTLPLPHLRNTIAVVPQDTILFNDTIAYNIAFGRPDASLEELHKAAHVARLHEFIMSLPDGYNTKVGERGVKLSGGEKQRVSIARAVLKNPRIYVFDEATSSLDSQTEQDILSSLREIARHSSTLVVAHRLSTIVHADEIVVLHQGQIVERGTHSGLLDQNGRYTAMWHAQQRTMAAA